MIGAIHEQHDKLRAKDGVSQGRLRRKLKSGAKLVLSTKDLGMGLGRLDNHNVAPIVLGGVYCLALLIGECTEEDLAAMKITMEIAELVALWTSVEKLQIRRQHHGHLQTLYARLSEQIVKLYKIIIVLLGTLMAYFDSKWRE